MWRLFVVREKSGAFNAAQEAEAGQTSNAFTLVELLVMAVIAILVALLLPKNKEAEEQGQARSHRLRLQQPINFTPCPSTYVSADFDGVNIRQAG